MAEETKVETKVVEPVTPVQASKGNNKTCLIVGCIVLALIACVGCLGIAALLIFSPNIITKTIFNQSPISQEDLTTLDDAQVESLSSSLDQKIENIENSNASTATLVVTEEEILAKIIKEGNLPSDTSIGVDFRNGSAEIVIPFDEILNTIQNNPELQGQLDSLGGFDPNTFLSGIVLMVEFETTPDGKEIVIRNVSTGNSFFDGLIQENLSVAGLGSETSDFLEGFDISNEWQVNRIEFREGEMVLELVK